MYEDIVAAARRSTEAAVQDSQERVDLAMSKSAQADKQAAEATKALGERWVNRINAMRRRAAERREAKNPEMRFGHEDGPHPNDHTEDDELVALSDAPPVDPAARTPAFGIPQEQIQRQLTDRYNPDAARFVAPIEEEQPPPPPRRQPPARRARPRDDEDEDYSGTSWLQGG
jgi:hypothetical protein